MNKIVKILSLVVGMTALFFLLSSFLLSSKASYSQPVGVSIEPVKIKKITEHLKTPSPVKAVYMSQCVAATANLRDRIIKLIDDTEINSVVIDVKDYSGTVSFLTGDPNIDSLSGSGCRVADLPELLNILHSKNIYTIGRITVFQDPLYTKAHPELAVKKKSDGGVWHDRKGIAFIDVGARPFWDHIADIAIASHQIGFDEINFDYIRYPSDGNMQDIDFTLTGTTSKKEKLKEFFEYLDKKMQLAGIVTSADIFGMTTTNTDDLGIGQILEYALLNFDYVAPMVYPSHYPPTFNGWPDPNRVPYKLIHYVMGSAVARANFLHNEIATTTRLVTTQATTTIVAVVPDKKLTSRVGPHQLRPWLQDFDYPVAYTPEMVEDQIKATYDVGLNSWMLWDPANSYTRAALLHE